MVNGEQYSPLYRFQNESSIWEAITLTGRHLAVLLEYGQMRTQGKLNNSKEKVLRRSIQPRSHRECSDYSHHVSAVTRSFFGAYVYQIERERQTDQIYIQRPNIQRYIYQVQIYIHQIYIHIYIFPCALVTFYLCFQHPQNKDANPQALVQGVGL